MYGQVGAQLGQVHTTIQRVCSHSLHHIMRFPLPVVTGSLLGVGSIAATAAGIKRYNIRKSRSRASVCRLMAWYYQWLTTSPSSTAISITCLVRLVACSQITKECTIANFPFWYMADCRMREVVFASKVTLISSDVVQASPWRCSLLKLPSSGGYQ